MGNNKYGNSPRFWKQITTEWGLGATAGGHAGMTTLPGSTLTATALGRPDPSLRGPTPASMEGFLQASVPHHSRASCRK